MDVFAEEPDPGRNDTSSVLICSRLKLSRISRENLELELVKDSNGEHF